MFLQEVIEKRRSIRKFKNIDISNDIILDIINSARLAPSAKNEQPWKFYIAKNEIKHKISELMKKWHYNNPKNNSSILSTSIAVDQAPILILVFRDSKLTSERNDCLSIGAAIEHMLLKATEYDLGSLWIAATYYVKDEISKIINTNLELYSAIAIGYPDQKPKDIFRKNLDDIIIK